MPSKKDSRPIRCAIYTRKSSEEGLQQDFNSLDAQREACEAFVLSQRHEGWIVLEVAYDDGGVSGATLERPGLRRLLSDVETGKVEIIVVYKVDRLTRALTDFAKIVDIFDAHHVSFVSVTQQFNTTTSMGRLTLNVLLSFAQFEREVTGERIRDKFLASRRKGMWMGGHPPFGYDVDNRKLVLNETEAKLVRRIFARYAETGSARTVKAELDAEGIRTKARVSRSGRPHGGRPFARGALYQMLKNKVYIAKAVHKGQAYPGQHEAIIDLDLWERVQRRLAANRGVRRNATNAKEPSLLAGLLCDAEGNRYTPSHAVSNGRRYRYYVERSLTTEGKSPKAQASVKGKRIAAGEIEKLVVDRLSSLLGGARDLLDLLGGQVREADLVDRMLQRAAALRRDLQDAPPARCREIVARLIRRIVLDHDEIRIEIAKAGARELLGIDDRATEALQASSDFHELRSPLSMRHRGSELKLIIEGDGHATPGQPDPALIKALVRGHAWMEQLTAGHARSTGDIAKAEGLTSSYVTRVMRLAFLAPDITTAILEGRQPPDLTARKLLRGIELPYDWEHQLVALRFGTR